MSELILFFIMVATGIICRPETLEALNKRCQFTITKDNVFYKGLENIDLGRIARAIACYYRTDFTLENYKNFKDRKSYWQEFSAGKRTSFLVLRIPTSKEMENLVNRRPVSVIVQHKDYIIVLHEPALEITRLELRSKSRCILQKFYEDHPCMDVEFYRRSRLTNLL